MGWYWILPLLVAILGDTCCYYNCDIDDIKAGRKYFSTAVEIGEVDVPGRNIAPAGLAHSRVFEDVLYFVNEDDGGNIVYTINATTADVIGSINITDVTNADWEGLAVNKCPHDENKFCIFVQDGGKDGPGPANKIYIIDETSDPAAHVVKTTNKIIEFQIQLDITETKSMYVDCQGNIYFFDTIDYQDFGATLLQIKDVGGQPTAVPIAMMKLQPSDSWPTGPLGASMSKDCSELLIKMPEKVFLIPVMNGIIRRDRLQDLPYLATDGEDNIEWDPWNDRYYLLPKASPSILKVATRSANNPKPKFTLGRFVGLINTEELENIQGLAISRTSPGFAYAISRYGNYNVLIIQINGAHSVGVINTGLSIVGLNFRDIATGKCPSLFAAPSCIFINSYTTSGKISKVFIFEEPEFLFGERDIILDDSNGFEYTLPASFTSAPRAITIGRLGEIYVMDYGSLLESITLFQLSISASGNTLVPLSSFVSRFLMNGPNSMDISPCYNEIIAKSWDNVWLFDITTTVADAVKESPLILPYMPENEGRAVAFVGCNSYMTTNYNDFPAPLLIYDRV